MRSLASIKKLGVTFGLFSLFILTIAACTGSDGPRGAKGATGAAGVQGPAGAQGADGASAESPYGLTSEASISLDKGVYVIGSDVRFVTYGRGFVPGEEVLIDFIVSNGKIVSVGGATADESGEWSYKPGKRFQITPQLKAGDKYFPLPPGVYMVKAQGFLGSSAVVPVLFVSKPDLALFENPMEE